MPKQNNCDDLNVESCVDENGQTIQGGDSYSVPTGRYVKHVVSVCETAGSGGGGGGSFDPSNYYTKAEVDALLAGLDVNVDLSDYYDKTEIDAILAEYYSKDEIDQLLKDIDAMNPDDYYTKDEVDEKFDELDTAGVSVVGGTFSAIDDIRTQQDVNNLLYGMILDGTHTDVSTSKVTVSDEQFAADNDLNNQKEINVYLDERLTEIEAIEGLDPSYFVTKPELLASQKEQDAVIEASFRILENQVLAIENDLNRNNDEDERVHSDLYAKIDELAESQVIYDDFAVRELVEAEKAYRIDGDAKLAAGLVEEARTRADEDFRLLARINGLEIPEMPGDYDDSGLRELIEQESALRVTGDAALMQLVNANGDRILELNNDLAVERQDRVQGDLTIQAELRTESEARQRGDSDLQAQIDALEVPENFEEIIERIDNDIQVTNQKVDFNAEETLRDQERQDQELEDYKAEVQTQQDAQDLATTDLADRVTELENTPPGTGAEYLGELKDVDLSPTRSPKVIENPHLWLHYVPFGDHGEGELSYRFPDTLILSEVAYPDTDPSGLTDRIKPGVKLNLQWTYASDHGDDTLVVRTFEKAGKSFEITFTENPQELFTHFMNDRFMGETCSVNVGYVGVDTDPIIPDPPDVPSFDAGTFLGFDEVKQLWVPKAIDVSGGGVTDLSDYYTKAEVDASQSAQDTRLELLEASGGGGSVELTNYYTKSETYSSSEVDDLIDGVTTNVEAKIATNTAAIVKVKDDIKDINEEQGTQNNRLNTLEFTLTTGLDERYTKTEVDQLIADIDIPDVPEVDLSNLLAKDENNRVSPAFRISSSTNSDTYISFNNGVLGLYNLREPSATHHAARQIDVTTGDAETLQAAKDYADAIDVSVNLDDYYTKGEVDASQKAQDDITETNTSLITANGKKLGELEQKVNNIDTSGDESRLSQIESDIESNTERIDNLAHVQGLPLGVIQMWIGKTAPTGWLICNGDTYDIAEYPELNQFLMTCYGTNSGVLPDFRGLYPAGAGEGASNRGGHTLTKNKQPEANAYHSQRTAMPTTPFVTAADGEHRHTTGNGGTVSGSSSEGRFYPSPTGDKRTSYNGVHTHDITGGDAVTRPPTLAVHFIIKTYA